MRGNLMRYFDENLEKNKLADLEEPHQPSLPYAQSFGLSSGFPPFGSSVHRKANAEADEIAATGRFLAVMVRRARKRGTVAP
jgi:hypothetical protein